MKTAPTIKVLFMPLLGGAAHFASAAEPSTPTFRPVIPRIYDDAETATWQLPQALETGRFLIMNKSAFHQRRLRHRPPS